MSMSDLLNMRCQCWLFLVYFSVTLMILTGKICVCSVQYQNGCLAASDLFHFMELYFYMKIIVTIIPADLVPLFILSQNDKNTRIFLFIASRDLLQRHVEFTIKSYTCHYHESSIIHSMVHQIDSKNEWLFLSAIFMAKFALVFVQAVESTFS